VAIETLNGANKVRSNELATEIAEQLGLPGTGGSDAHALWQVGRCVTVFEREIRSQEELVSELRRGRYAAHYLEELKGQGREV
jgi:predicted metal-dependent phosphoesterase TrpH